MFDHIPRISLYHHTLKHYARTQVRPKRKCQSTCHLEIDANVNDIINQDELEEKKKKQEDDGDKLSLSHNDSSSNNISRQHAADASTMSITRLDVTGDEDKAFKYVPSLKRFWREEKRRREMFRAMSPTQTSVPQPSPTPSRDVRNVRVPEHFFKHQHSKSHTGTTAAPIHERAE